MQQLYRLTLILGVAAATGCVATRAEGSDKPGALPKATSGQAVAIFAGGCFWCMEKPFDVIDGVISTTSGYTDGKQKNPTYRQVSAGRTGHTEAVQIIFDPKKVTYARLLEVFWHNIDPTVQNRQFCDGGTQYRSGIYYLNDRQKKLAEASKATIAKQIKGTIHTELKAATPFYAAEAYHQDFYKKSPRHYKRYRRGCGRDQRLNELWGDKAGH